MAISRLNTFPTNLVDQTSEAIENTQDVMEHVFDPFQVFREISHTLRPGEAHVVTVEGHECHSSRKRVELLPDGSINNQLPARYHGNPVDGQGPLVSINWGDNICQAIAYDTDMSTEVYVNESAPSHYS